MSNEKNTQSEQTYAQKTQELTQIKLMTLEEYQEKSEILDLYDWEVFLATCQSLWGVPDKFERYASSFLQSHHFVAMEGQVVQHLRKGIRLQELDPTMIPLIPIVEFKLVPTGKVIYYNPEQNDSTRNKELWAKRKKERCAVVPKWDEEDDII